MTYEGHSCVRATLLQVMLYDGNTGTNKQYTYLTIYFSVTYAVPAVVPGPFPVGHRRCVFLLFRQCLGLDGRTLLDGHQQGRMALHSSFVAIGMILVGDEQPLLVPPQPNRRRRIESAF